MKAKKSKTDIVEIILQDHKPLKRLIKVLKSEKEIGEKRKAFEEFAPLLVAHAKPEEQTLYVHMKHEEELRPDAFEGDTEHALADQLIEEVKQAADEDVWEAKAKVLAELVEHHIEEEEEEMFPEVRKTIDLAEREKIGEEYLRLRDEMGEDIRLAS